MNALLRQPVRCRLLKARAHREDAVIEHCG